MWGANLDRIDPTWELTLTDFSAGMIDAARVAFTGDLEAVRAAVAACLERVGTFHIGKSSGVLRARKR